jgi:hypothetical protein
VTSRNNILDVKTNSIRTDAEITLPNSTFDYDLCTGAIPEGTEENGITEGEPEYEDETDELLESSPGYDGGMILWNFNDANSAWPYTGTAPDMGAVEDGGEAVANPNSGRSKRMFAMTRFRISGGKIYVDGISGKELRIDLLDMEGRTVPGLRPEKNGKVYVVPKLPCGVYMVKAKTGEGSVVRRAVAVRF